MCAKFEIPNSFGTAPIKNQRNKILKIVKCFAKVKVKCLKCFYYSLYHKKRDKTKQKLYTLFLKKAQSEIKNPVSL